MGKNRHCYCIELESVLEPVRVFKLSVGDGLTLHNDSDPGHPPIEISFESVKTTWRKTQHNIKIFLNPYKRDLLLEMIDPGSDKPK